MTAQSGLGFSGIVAIQIPDDGAIGEVLTKITADNYDYDWLPGGGGGGAPTDAEYVVMSLNGTLTDERVLTAGTGISIVDGGAGSTVTINVTGSPTDLQDAYDEDTTPPQIVVNATPDPVTIDASVAGDVFAVTDVAGADLLRLSTTSGLVVGGSNAGNQLTIQGSNAANRGRVLDNGGMTIDWDWTTDAITAGGIYWNNTVAASGALVSAFITLRLTNTVTAGTFIMSALDDNSTHTWSVVPGFSVMTLFFARPTYQSTTFGVPPAQAFIYAAQAQYRLTGAGAVTVPNYRALSFAPIFRVDNAGDDLSMTNTNGVTVGPLYNTRNATAVADYGNLRGVHMLNAAAVLFGQSLGSEIASNWIGLDCEAMTGLVVSGVRAAVRSAIPSAANTRFLQNTGGAESDFGIGDIHLNDDTYIKFGQTGIGTTGDMWIGWASAIGALNFSTFAGVGSNPMRLRATAADEWNFEQDAGGLTDIGIRFDVNAIVFGNAATATPNSNNWFGLFGPPNLRQVQIGGEYSDFLFSAGGSADINGLAVSNFQNFKFNAPAFILNGGTVTDASNIFVDGMLSFGATLVQALRVTGRTTIRGRINQPSEQPAQITANQNDYQLAANNGQRGVAILDSDAAYNITGIDASFGRSQDAERITLINLGSFALTLTHQDAASAATNRFISPTGVGYVLGPNESCEIYYLDDGTDRWLILWGSGA